MVDKIYEQKVQQLSEKLNKLEMANSRLVDELCQTQMALDNFKKRVGEDMTQLIKVLKERQ